MDAVNVWAGIFALAFSQGLRRQEPPKYVLLGRLWHAGALLWLHVTHFLGRSWLTVPCPTSIFPSPAESVAEKQVPGLIV